MTASRAFSIAVATMTAEGSIAVRAMSVTGVVNSNSSTPRRDLPPPHIPKRRTAQRDGAATGLQRRPKGIPVVRALLVMVGLGLVVTSIAGQILRLSTGHARNEAQLQAAEPMASTRTAARPEILDRSGRIIATDVAASSLYADPALVLDRDEVVEKLMAALPGLDESELRRALADTTRRFVWIKRGLMPVEAQRVHELGLPGLAFRREPKRVYPAGSEVGHLIGHVNIDNRGAAGIERHIDEALGVETTLGSIKTRQAPVRLTLDLGVQHAVAHELRQAMSRYLASGAVGLVMDATNGAIVAAVSLPAMDPNRPVEALDPDRRDRLQAGVYELGSIFKLLTVAMTLDDGSATLAKTYDTTRPLEIGRHTIKDLYPAGRALNVRDIFIQSSNVGAGLIALESGAERQRAFLERLGLLAQARTEAGAIAAPLLPSRWDRIETVTISYGHGLAVAPIQFAAAVATLINGGRRVQPTYLGTITDSRGEAVLKPDTSQAMRDLMRLNVVSAQGTGRRADVPGYDVGGKTGTAEMPGEKGYQKRAVIASFLGAFPMSAPRYVTLVSLYEPKPIAETQGQITAGVNAAPVTARVIERIAPILGVLPRRLEGQN